MEKNKINDNRILDKENASVKEIPKHQLVNEMPANFNLTNEQKLEYLSRLIQEVEANLSSSDIEEKSVQIKTRI